MNKALQKIGQMVGNSYMYKKEVYTIKGFIPEDQTVRIKTDREDLVLLYDGLDHQLGYFLEAEQEEAVVLPAIVRQSEVQSSIGSLAHILQDNIKRVRDDKEFIPQAEAIASSVKTIIDLAKAEIEYRKTELEYAKLRSKA